MSSWKHLIGEKVREIQKINKDPHLPERDRVIEDIAFVIDNVCATNNHNDNVKKFATFYVNKRLDYHNGDPRYEKAKDFRLSKIDSYRMFAFHARKTHVHGKEKSLPLRNSLCFAVCAFSIVNGMNNWISRGCRTNDDDEAYKIINDIYYTCDPLKTALFKDGSFPQRQQEKYLSLYCRIAERAEKHENKPSNDKHCDRTYVWNVLFGHGNDDIDAVWNDAEIEARIQVYLADLLFPHDRTPSRVVKNTAPVPSPSPSAHVSYKEKLQPQYGPRPTSIPDVSMSVAGNTNTTPPVVPPRVLQQQQNQVPYVGGTPMSAAAVNATSFPCFTPPAMQQNTWVPPVPAPAPAAMPVPSFHYPFSFMAGPPPPTMIVKANICVVMEVLMQALIIHPNGDRKYVEPYSYDIWVVLVRTLLRTDVSSHTVAQEIQGILTRCGSMVWNMNGIISEITKKRVSQDVSTAFASFAHVVLTNHNNALALTQSIEDCRRALFQA